MARFLLAYSQSKRAPELRTMSAERSGAGSTSVGRARPGAGRSLRSRRAENTRRVVVVEDDPPTANLLTDVLADAGFTVTVLDSALGAHEAIHRLRPCAVLLDLGLPYRSGASLLRELKADPATAIVPVVVVSAYTESLSRESAAQAAAVVPKPFELGALLAAVQAAA